MASFMEVLQTSRRSQNFSTIAYCSSLYQATFSCRAATKEIQRVIPLMMGHHTYEGPYVSVRILCEERAHAISRYAADHGVAFPDLLNTEADEGHAVFTTHKIVPPFFKTNRTVLKWFEAHVVFPVVGVKYIFV